MATPLDQLYEELSSSNTDQLIAAVRQLGEQHVWEALEELVRLLEPPEYGFSVAQALTAYGPEICKRTELEYSLFHPRKEVCYRAAWVLGFFGDQRAVKPLQDAIKEPFFHAPYLPMLKRLGAPNLEHQIVRELSRHRESTASPAARYRSVTFLHALSQMQSTAALDLAPLFLGEPHDPLVRQYAQHYLSAVAPDQRKQA